MNVVRIGVGILLVASIVFALSLIRSNKKSNQACVVINVLDNELYEDCHIKGSISVPYNQLEQYAASVDKNTELVVYCSNALCSASHAAAATLMKLGFQKVWVYEGGMAEWYQHKMPVEGSCTQSYLTNEVSITRTGTDTSRVLSTQELARKMGY